MCVINQNALFSAQPYKHSDITLGYYQDSLISSHTPTHSNTKKVYVVTSVKRLSIVSDNCLKHQDV